MQIMSEYIYIQLLLLGFQMCTCFDFKCLTFTEGKKNVLYLRGPRSRVRDSFNNGRNMKGIWQITSTEIGGITFAVCKNDAMLFSTGQLNNGISLPR